MLQIGMQTRKIIEDTNPLEGFQQLKSAGFSCADFSLNAYLDNKSVYKGKVNDFFDKSIGELEAYFTPHKVAAKTAGIRIHQMHMPYPLCVPNGKPEVNDYLQGVVAPKSLYICKFFECKYIVVHGFKLARHLGSEALEWKATEDFLHSIAPLAIELGITLCVENLYDAVGGRMEKGPCCDARIAAERIDRFNAQYGAEVLGFCLDVGHANLTGLDIYDFIVTLGTRLKVLHIHDNDGIRDLHQIPYTFSKAGDCKYSVNWDSFVKGLREISFDGVLNFEASPAVQSFPKEMQGDVLSFFAKIGENFIERIERA